MRLRSTLLVSASLLAVLTLGSALAQKKTITVAAWAGNDKLIQDALPGFMKANPDIEVKVVGGLGYGDYHPALNNRLQAGNAEDVVSLGGQFVVDYANGSFLDDLNTAPYNVTAAWKRGFVASQVALATGPKGSFVAVPSDVPPVVMYYRRDVLAKAGLKPADITGSWERYIEAGKKLKAQGIFISSGAENVESAVISTNIPAGQGVYFDAAGKPVVTSDRFVRAFTLAKQVRDLGLDSRITGWTPEWFDAFKSGKMVTQIAGSWFENTITGTIDKDGAGKWAVALPPERSTAPGGGAFYAIPSAGKHKAEAWKLVQYLTSPAVQVQIFKASGNFPANLATLRDPLFNQGSAYFGGQKVYQVYASAAKLLRPVPQTPNYAIADSIVNDALKQVLEQGKDIKTALADAQSLIERRTSR